MAMRLLIAISLRRLVTVALLVGGSGLLTNVALADRLVMEGDPLVDIQRESVGRGMGALVETPHNLEAVYRRRYAGYISKFKHLEILSVNDGRVIARRAGRRLMYRSGEIIGPGRQFHAEIGASALHLVANATGKRMATIPLPSVTSATEPRSMQPVPAAVASVQVLPKAQGEAPRVETQVPDVRLPQLTVVDSTLGRTLGFLVRDLALRVEMSPQEASIPVERFRVRGGLALVLQDLATQFALFITYQDGVVRVSKKEKTL